LVSIANDGFPAQCMQLSTARKILVIAFLWLYNSGQYLEHIMSMYISEYEYGA